MYQHTPAHIARVAQAMQLTNNRKRMYSKEQSFEWKEQSIKGTTVQLSRGYLRRVPSCSFWGGFLRDFGDVT